MRVVVYEPSDWPAFAPLSLSRPVCALLGGMSLLLDRQLRDLNPDHVTLWVRPELAGYCRRFLSDHVKIPLSVNEPLDDRPTLLVDARLLETTGMDATGPERIYVDANGRMAGALLRRPGLGPQDALEQSAVWMRLKDLPSQPFAGAMVGHIWDLILRNVALLSQDADRLPAPGDPAPGPYHLVESGRVHIAKDAILSPGCVLDASQGPVVISSEASIGANSVIQGPCWIGRGTRVSPLTIVRPGASIGPMCKVGGELANCLIMGYSNKAHEGFLGDSYLGEWVNFGAGTVTSNLKNTYGEIRVRIGGREISTGCQFLGALVGDHVKTAVGTRLTTGAYLGYCSMIACSSLPPRFVPSMTFLTDKGAESFDANKARQMMTAMFARRRRDWNEDEEMIFEHAIRAAALVERP